MLEVFFSLTCVPCLHSFKCERIPCIQKPKLRTCWRSFVFFATNPIIDFVGCIIWQIQSAYFKWDLCLTLVVKLIKLNSFCATCQCGWLTPHCCIWYITHVIYSMCEPTANPTPNASYLALFVCEDVWNITSYRVCMTNTDIAVTTEKILILLRWNNRCLILLITIPKHYVGTLGIDTEISSLSRDGLSVNSLCNLRGHVICDDLLRTK